MLSIEHRSEEGLCSTGQVLFGERLDELGFQEGSEMLQYRIFKSAIAPAGRSRTHNVSWIVGLHPAFLWRWYAVLVTITKERIRGFYLAFQQTRHFRKIS